MQPDYTFGPQFDPYPSRPDYHNPTNCCTYHQKPREIIPNAEYDDTYLLEVILKAYNLTRESVIAKIEKKLAQDSREEVIREFCQDYPEIIHAPADSQWNTFSRWICVPHFTREEVISIIRKQNKNPNLH